MVEAPGSTMIRLLVGVAGIAVMIGVSALLSWYNSTRVSFRIGADAADAKANVVDPPAVGPAKQSVGSGPS